MYTIDLDRQNLIRLLKASALSAASDVYIILSQLMGRANKFIQFYEACNDIKERKPRNPLRNYIIRNGVLFLEGLQGIRISRIYFCCSSRDSRIQGSGVGNCSVGTPSSNSLETAAEKSLKKTSSLLAYALAYFLKLLSWVRT